MGGEPQEANLTGVFYLTTNGFPPYGRGKNYSVQPNIPEALMKGLLYFVGGIVNLVLAVVGLKLS